MNDDILTSISKQFTKGIRQAVERMDIPDPVDWIEKNFYIPETRKDHKLQGKIRLMQYQKDAIREALSTDENGNYKYSIIVWSDIKKSAKCVHPDTEIIMADGSVKLARNLSVGDNVTSFSDGMCRKSEISNIEWQNQAEMYRIVTSRGRELLVSAEHPFLVNGNSIYPSQAHLYKKSIKGEQWINAKDLKVGDRVVIGLGWAEYKEVDTEDFYLAGAYTGDGGQARITTNDEEIRDAFAGRFSLTALNKMTYYLGGCSEWLKKYGFLHGTIANWKNFSNSHTKKVPPVVFCSGVQGIAAFLSGYLDTDGSVSNTRRKQPAVTWSSINRELLQGCQSLLAAIGINGTLFRHDTSLNGKVFEAYTLAVYGREQVVNLAKLLTPRVKHKANNLSDWIKKLDSRSPKRSKGKSLYSSDRVVATERIDDDFSIAVEVEDFHTHITNGIVTHNSTIAAAINLYRAHFAEFGEFYIIANDLKQADSRVNYYLRRALQLNPKLNGKYQRLGYRTTAPSGSFIEAIPIDPSGEAGSNADQITFSELWGANEEAKQNMWAEMTLSPTKHGRSFRWIESYAGFQEESELLYSLYDLGVIRGQMLWPDRLYEVTDGTPAPLELYVNRGAGMLCLWNTQPRCPWQTKAYYAAEEQVLPPNQFARMHRNQWVSSTETFVPMEWWHACKRIEYPKIDQTRHAMVIALDAAVSDDTFGLWMGCRHPEKMDEVLSQFVQRWKPVQGHKVDFVGTEEKPGPELVLKRLIKDYNVVEVAYDPYQLHDMATRLKQQGLAWFREFSQGNDRLEADSQFRALIREKRFWHRGEAEFTEHIQNANAKVDQEDRRLRIVKRAEKLKIDLAVAASMGSYEVLRLNL